MVIAFLIVRLRYFKSSEGFFEPRVSHPLMEHSLKARGLMGTLTADEGAKTVTSDGQVLLF